MRKINKYLIMAFCFLMVLLFSHCGKRTNQECNSIKIQLLLEDLFRKKDYYPTFSSLGYPIDSSKFFVYLYQTNLKIPNKKFYLHWNKDADPSYPDSILLREIDNPSIRPKYSHQVSIKILEQNKDTTKLKIALGYSDPSDRAINKGVFSYSFDETNCKWIVLDSTLERY